MRPIAMVFLTVSLLSVAVPGQAQASKPFVGLRYTIMSEPNETPINQNLPTGLESQGGWVVGNPFKGKEYIMAIYKQGDRQWFWFEQTLAHQIIQRSQGLANYMTRLVLDTIPAPLNVYGVIGCERNRQSNPEIFALVKPSTQQNSEWITEFYQVWRANRSTRKLEAINPRGVRCPNPGWGV